jgi:hypothetical protein
VLPSREPGDNCCESLHGSVRRLMLSSSQTKKKNPSRQEIHWVRTGESPAPGTTQFICCIGWSTILRRCTLWAYRGPVKPVGTFSVIPSLPPQIESCGTSPLFPASSPGSTAPYPTDHSHDQWMHDL